MIAGFVFELLPANFRMFPNLPFVYPLFLAAFLVVLTLGDPGDRPSASVVSGHDSGPPDSTSMNKRCAAKSMTMRGAQQGHAGGEA